ncbi:hypothetical protein AVEN_150051-1 [Araneus ventricosus]|uniref:Uncharacterized protein n=1 Tax=Araneus ventricosus TaxID=182803 RepID=A0A4Y2GX01_ARAVE|nr:hypothetical protein AVEN_150051-1 [Araneus ventricosus]
MESTNIYNPCSPRSFSPTEDIILLFIMMISSVHDLITKNHPALPWHPGRHERPAAATGSQALWFLHNSPITNGSCNNPPFYKGTTCLRRWTLRATPPLLYPPGR